MKILLVHPGASWSTADVEAGLRDGLEAHGATIIRYRLDGRIDRAASWLQAAWRKARRDDPTLIRPTPGDVCYLASTDAIAVALRHQVDLVLVVSAMFFHPDAVILLRRAGLRVAALFTESPYDLPRELEMAQRIDHCWTNERTAVDAFTAAGASCRYLPHAWHPHRHGDGAQTADADLPAHDVVFVGSGFPERVAWLEAVDWTGIDLGLYGHWALGRRSPLRRHVKGQTVPNTTAAALYRRAAIGLNLYRHADGAESLNPRAYELAACGCFHLSDARAEVGEVFGSRVPILEDPTGAGDLVRYWLAHPIARATIASELPACVTSSTWTARAGTVLEDGRALLQEHGNAEIRRQGRRGVPLDERVRDGDRHLSQQVVA